MSTRASLGPTSALSPLLALTRNEARLIRREPAFIVWAVLAPLIADVVLASLPATREVRVDLGGRSWWQIYLSVLVVFAISFLAMQVLPGVLAGYRADGVLRRLRTTPVSPLQLIVALSAVCCGLAMITVVVLVSVPLVLGNTLPGDPLTFSITALGFLAASLGIGAVIMALSPSTRFAMGLGTVVTMLTWFAAGLWVPRVVMPEAMLTICDLTPGGAAARGFAAAMAGSGPDALSLIVLVSWTLVCGAAGARIFRWE